MMVAVARLAIVPWLTSGVPIAFLLFVVFAILTGESGEPPFAGIKKPFAFLLHGLLVLSGTASVAIVTQRSSGWWVWTASYAAGMGVLLAAGAVFVSVLAGDLA